MGTPNKKSRITLLTPCRRLGLNRSPRNFTPPFKNKLKEESPLASSNSTEKEDTKLDTTPIRSNRFKPKHNDTKVDTTPVKVFPKSKSKLVFEDPKSSINSELSNELPEEESSEEITQSDLLRRKRELAIKKRRLRELQSRDKCADDLIAQIAIWKTGCREVLEELVKSTHHNSGDRNRHIIDLLNSFNISCELIGYDPELGDFLE